MLELLVIKDFLDHVIPIIHGDYNTYKFENRFTFKTIGDTERFH